MIEYEGYLYNADGFSMLKGIGWRCVERKICNGKLFTDANYTILSEVRHIHTHTCNTDLILQKEISNEIKKDAISTNEPSKDIVVRALKGKTSYQWGSLQKAKTLNNIVSLTRRINTGFEGSTDEYEDIPEKYKFMKDGQKFVLFDWL
ncbi:hypothetical protein NGRA_2376 [Nosema granulosis]|uniref:FLYWCH-type domain-containing protein n=1 Tax=Nosema granulosis TaxID=83296 RepID=A0A9P6GXS8_9MICR|nr:hypothetical protein NGRA_2376 [Nosema granulosis]